MKTPAADVVDQVVHELVRLSQWVMRESGRPLELDGMERATNAMLDQRGISKDRHLVDYLMIAALTTHDFVRAHGVETHAAA